MTENKPFELIINERGLADIIDWSESKEKNAICIYNDLGMPPYSSEKAVCNKLNEQDGMIQRLNQEILSCHDTLVTIEALCDAVLNYDFKNVTDNKDLIFLKECFEAIRNNDLKQMTSLTVECMGDVK